MSRGGSRFLLDGNVLIALSIQPCSPGDRQAVACRRSASHRQLPDHPGDARPRLAARWRQRRVSAAVPDCLLGNPRHQFWVDDIGYEEVALGGVVGHRRVTDAYLAQLARHRGGLLATLDRGLAAAHDEVCVLIS